MGGVLAKRGHDVTLLISERRSTPSPPALRKLRFEKMPFLAMPKPWSPKIGFLKGLWQGANAAARSFAIA